MGKFEQSYQDFHDKALDLLVLDPIRTRVVLKYISRKSAALIKVTDDKRSIHYKFRTEKDFEFME